MMQFLLYTGIGVFGLFYLIRPQLFLKRKYGDKEIPARDIRFFRVLGGILVGLYALGYII